MDVFIKSFNRPYYLERCIQSVLLNVIHGDLSIIVLDDGTNPKHLQRIQEKYPSVRIELSPFYYEKVKKIERLISDGTNIEEMEIPTQFWLSHISGTRQEYFIILEDDIWFIEKIDLRATIETMNMHNMCMLKLFYFNNPKLISGTQMTVSPSVNVIKPKLPLKNQFLFKNLWLGNPFKLWSILSKFGIKNNGIVNYYTIYNVAGAIFSKSYYSYLWKDFSGKVNEHQQLIKALDYYNREKSKTYGVVTNDVLNTSFSSSATNTFDGVNFNPFLYNSILNTAWYEGKLDPMSGYPKDILTIDIERILERDHTNLVSVAEWRKWADRFREQYQKLGFSI